MKLLLMLVLAVVAEAQDWVPKKAVAITTYPPLGRQARIQGDVVINCFLDDEGNVVKTEAISGHPLLQAQARVNALLWKFQLITALPGKKPITLLYRYRLLKEESQSPQTTCEIDLPDTIQVTSFAPQVNP